METPQLINLVLAVVCGVLLLASTGLFAYGMRMSISAVKDTDTTNNTENKDNAKRFFKCMTFVLLLLFVLFPCLFIIKLKFFSKMGLQFEDIMKPIDITMTVVGVMLAFAVIVGTAVQCDKISDLL